MGRDEFHILLLLCHLDSLVWFLKVLFFIFPFLYFIVTVKKCNWFVIVNQLSFYYLYSLIRYSCFLMELSWLSNDIVCHLHILAILPLPFHFGYLVFLFLVWLMQLGFPIVCWIEVMKVNIHVFFHIFPHEFSWNGFQLFTTELCWLWDIHKWLLLRLNMFPLYPVW